MEALFGLLHSDSRCRVSAAMLKKVASVLPLSSPRIHTDGSFGLCLNRIIIENRTQKDSVAFSPDRSLWLAITGEIEDPGAIVRECERTGPKISGTSDADALLEMFLLHGPFFIRRVQGFFNIVVWDASHRKLLVYADRCGGVRPMYYYHGRDFLCFGSCLKAVIAYNLVPRELDPTGLDELLSLGHPIAPRTLFKGISMVTAGTFLEYWDGTLRVHRYWKREPYRRSKMDLQELGNRYFSALEAAVERCVDTTAETGILLSGGVDSAVIVSLLHRAGHRRLRTFSIHIGAPDYNDRDASKFIADTYHTEHRSIEALDENCLELLPEMIWYHEIPGVDFHPTYLLCLEAKKQCDLVIGGYGNDLIWGVLTPLHALERLTAAHTPAFSVLRYFLCRRRETWKNLRKLREHFAQAYVRLFKRIGHMAHRTGHPLTDMIYLDETLFGDQRVFFELGKFIVDAHDMWIRMPYCDSVVTRISEAIPPDLRYRRDATGHLELKSFFKDVMRDHQVLPKKVIYRPKKWMYSPTAEWLRGPMGRILEAIALSRSAHERDCFDIAGVRGLIREHRAGLADHTYIFMMLAGIEIWHRLFIDPPAIASPELNLSDYATI